MKTLPLAEVKAKLSRLVDEVKNFDEEITITKNGRAAAMIISLDEYEGLKETIEIMSNADFMKEIREGIKAYKKGKTRLYTLEELFDE